ncbi:MAG: cadherin-like beta sandwich domain-containing protein [Candidatus Thiodiazotropha sp. L084R]
MKNAANLRWPWSHMLSAVVIILLSLSILGCGSGNGNNSENNTTTSSDASLSDLTVAGAALDQIFQSSQMTYTASVNYLQDNVSLTPFAAAVGASIKINGIEVVSGIASAAITLTEGENLISLDVTAEDAVTTQRYAIEILRQSAAQIAQQLYLKASDVEEGDKFGTSMAISGDTLVVGAPGVANNACDGEGDSLSSDSGAVYVFTRNGGVWSQQACLKASNTGLGDQFGASIAIYDDTLVVGAPKESRRSGAAYVFVRINGIWSEQAYLKASNAEGADISFYGGDQFGASVAISGDTLVVGAPFEDTSDRGSGFYSGTGSGAAYVFTRSGEVWSQQAYLKSSNGDAADQFGTSLAVSHDTLVVGAPFEDSSVTGGESDNSASDAGAVYVFNRSGGVWSQQAYLKSSNGEVQDQFGTVMAISGDTLVVAAPLEDDSVEGGVNLIPLNDSGATYVFTRSDGVWSQQAYLKANNAGWDDQFGASIAISGDNLVVGAPGEASSANAGERDNNTALAAGAAYLFSRSDGIWSQQSYLKASNVEAEDKFGSSVAISSDTLVVGAPEEASNESGGEGDNSTSGAGATYIWR